MPARQVPRRTGRSRTNDGNQRAPEEILPCPAVFESVVFTREKGAATVKLRTRIRMMVLWSLVLGS
jgi:hypothetical protein